MAPWLADTSGSTLRLVTLMASSLFHLFIEVCVYMCLLLLSLYAPSSSCLYLPWRWHTLISVARSFIRTEANRISVSKKGGKACRS